MKKSHAQKLTALKASGASAEEIAKMAKTQKRNRVLGLLVVFLEKVMLAAELDLLVVLWSAGELVLLVVRLQEEK